MKDNPSISKKPTRRHFTQAAREAAQRARRAKIEARLSAPEPEHEIFAIRSGEGYGWELRRFGGVVVVSDAGPFATPSAARAAGGATWDALIARRVEHAGAPLAERR